MKKIHINESEINTICEKYNIKNYSINPDGSIDVMDNVNLNGLGLTELPLKFNNVYGYFNCVLNKLTTLKSSPIYVSGSFDWSSNELKNLIGIGKVNGNNIFCYANPLESFDGYNDDLDKLYCNNKEKIIRKNKLKLIKKL